MKYDRPGARIVEIDRIPAAGTKLLYPSDESMLHPATLPHAFDMGFSSHTP